MTKIPAESPDVGGCFISAGCLCCLIPVVIVLLIVLYSVIVGGIQALFA